MSGSAQDVVHLRERHPSTPETKESIVPMSRAWIALAAILVAITAVLGAPVDYAPALHDALAAVLLLAALACTWFAGARAIAGADESGRLPAVAGTLLVAPFVLFSLLPGAGPPRVQPVADNELRFLLLAIDAILVGVGLLVLKEALTGVGERLCTTLGGAAAVIACPLYVLFALVQRIDYVAEDLGWSWAASVANGRHELTPLDALSIAALFFAGALTYVATFAFARSLASAGWLGARTALVLQAVSALGLGFLVARGFSYPSPHAAFSHWYTVPGFVAGIPAVPWMPLCAIGVLLLRRASGARAAATLSPPAPPVARSATT
jgi:hypothetical protein